MIMQRSIQLGLTLAMLALVGGCNADGRCLRNSDCDEGYSCQVSVCVADPVDAAAADAATDDASSADPTTEDASAADATADDASAADATADDASAGDADTADAS